MLNKSFSLSLLILLCTLANPFAAAKQFLPDAPNVDAKAWILVDADTGYVIAEQNADDTLPPASLAKMMTTYITSKEIAENRLKEDDLVVISDNAWELGGAKTDGSTMFLSPRSKVPVIDLMRGVIIQSGNDAAISLAEHISGGETAFSDNMNYQAELMGMTNTYYMNATGLPAEGMVTSARDLTILAKAIINEHPEYYSIYSEKYFSHNNINQPNRNRLLWRDSSIDGLKTGHTEAAGYCLVASSKRRGMRLISAVLGAKSDDARARESQKLFSYGFRHFETKKIYSAGELIKENAALWYGEEDFLNLTVENDITLTYPKGEKKNLSAQITVDNEISAPITAGQVLGSLEITLDGKTMTQVSLVAEKDIAEAGFFSRFFDWILLFFTQLLS
ncbi:MAG: D-alanyl-D-alanine carboxypeptidase family protein [Porticoccaceae bacterium]|nr:D-alanyl-D-alanine carboxypeptidase [Cellvibrionales bacterium]MDA7744198.1 D-alanyl-D-alanine carboxypeptidase [Porticoccaceae bacterium]MDA7795077.1 D-alanyl-D-alanine carboxypeptidase [Porticoccaceae bacterium]MDA8898401.1 D-alanyl-D-alanine carboxypeptidase [Porticoccaceae bacterium]MDB3926004.1 D-alanyl-D-alanine carboxypeptidase [Porticoccaceae bacterium]